MQRSQSSKARPVVPEEEWDIVKTLEEVENSDFTELDEAFELLAGRLSAIVSPATRRRRRQRTGSQGSSYFSTDQNLWHQTSVGSFSSNKKAVQHVFEITKLDCGAQKEVTPKREDQHADEVELNEWAREWIAKSTSAKNRSVSVSGAFKERLEYRFKWWQAVHTSNGVSSVPVPIFPQPPASRARMGTFVRHRLLTPSVDVGKDQSPSKERTLRSGGKAFTPRAASGNATPRLPVLPEHHEAHPLSHFSTAEVLEVGSPSFSGGISLLPKLVTSKARSSLHIDSHQVKPERIFREAYILPEAPDMTDAEIQLLKRAPQFEPPHRVPKGTTSTSSIEYLYLRRCELAGLVPRPEVWRPWVSDGSVDATGTSLGDPDLITIVETAVQGSKIGHTFRELQLSGNRLTDSGLEKVSALLIGPPNRRPGSSHLVSRQTSVCTKLTSISLANNSTLRFRDSALAEAFANSLTALPALAKVDVSGVPLRGRAAIGFANILEEFCPNLRNLGMAGCGLGSGDQSDCIAVVSLLSQSNDRRGLESADFSSNFFGAAAFSATASRLRKSRIRHLAFASNCGAVVPIEGKSHLKSPRARAESTDVSSDDGRASCLTPASQSSEAEMNAQRHGNSRAGNPIQVLFEGLHFNRTLESLDVSNCSIGPDSVFVLEQALAGHSKVKSINLADNPLGVHGLQFAVRMVALLPGLQSLEVQGVRDNVAGTQVMYSHQRPFGLYRLDLSKPLHRSILRWLLSLNEQHHKLGIFRCLKYDPRPPKHSIEQDQEAGAWTMPQHGVYAVTYQPPISDAARNLKKARTTAPVPQRATRSLLLPHLPERAEGYEGALAALDLERPKVNQRASVSFADVHIAEDKTEAVRTMHRTSLREKKALPDDSADRTVSAPSRPSALDNLPPQMPPGELGTPEGDWSELSKLLRQSRNKVEDVKFKLLLNVYSALDSQSEKLLFLEACSRELLLTEAQVHSLCEHFQRTELFPKVAGMLFSTMTHSHQMKFLLDIPCPTAVLKEVGHLFWFQDGNPTGSYNLNLKVPSDYALAETLLLVNAWESAVARIAGRPDMSQTGNNDMLRNETYEEMPFTYVREWTLPSRGWLRFDYSSTRRPPPKADPVTEMKLEEFIRYLQVTNVSFLAKMRALRAVSVHLFLTTSQIREILHCFDACHTDDDRPDESPERQDIFCLFHTRIVDRERLLGPDLFFTPIAHETHEEKAPLAKLNTGMKESKQRKSEVKQQTRNTSKNPLTMNVKSAEADATGGGLNSSRKTVRFDAEDNPGTEAISSIPRRGARMSFRASSAAMFTALIRKPVDDSSVTLHQADQLALINRLGVLHVFNPINPEVSRLPANLLIRDQRVLVQYLVSLSDLEPGGRVLGWNLEGQEVHMPTSWNKLGVPEKDRQYRVSYDSWQRHLSYRYALSEQFTVGFYADNSEKNC